MVYCVSPTKESDPELLKATVDLRVRLGFEKKYSGLRKNTLMAALEIILVTADASAKGAEPSIDTVKAIITL